MPVTRSSDSSRITPSVAVALQSCRAVSPERSSPWQGGTGASTLEPFAYDEETFRHLLDLEEQRSQRSGRPFLLVLLDVNAAGVLVENGNERALDELFRTLVDSLRETDFVGWYRSGQVVGAVLTQLGETAEKGEISQLIREKFDRALHGLSPWARLLKVQIHQLPSAEAKTGTNLWR